MTIADFPRCGNGYRGTSLIRNSLPLNTDLGPYIRSAPRALRWS